jgi:quercetin dioxygenase-like cupin family protein
MSKYVKPTFRKRTKAILLSGLFVLVTGCSSNAIGQISSEVLLDKTDLTIVDESFSYPTTDNPEVTSVIITVPPGAETGWHLHEAPMYAYILEGTLEVTYTVDGVDKTKVYKKGQAIMEALKTPHNGRNNSNSTVKVLVVNFGSPDLENTVKL